MKKIFSPIWLVVIAVFALPSCSPKLVGTWNIDRYETTEPGQKPASLSNIGTITFKKNGRGEKNINYTLFGKARRDNSDFGWHATGPYVGIESPNSEFSKTWIVTTNKKKKQNWKSTDGANRVQVLELRK